MEAISPVAQRALRLGGSAPFPGGEGPGVGTFQSAMPLAASTAPDLIRTYG